MKLVYNGRFVQAIPMFCDVQRLKERIYLALFQVVCKKTNANIGLPINQARQPQYDFGENDANREARCL